MAIYNVEVESELSIEIFKRRELKVAISKFGDRATRRHKVVDGQRVSECRIRRRINIREANKKILSRDRVDGVLYAVGQGLLRCSEARSIIHRSDVDADRFSQHSAVGVRHRELQL